MGVFLQARHPAVGEHLSSAAGNPPPGPRDTARTMSQEELGGVPEPLEIRPAIGEGHRDHDKEAAMPKASKESASEHETLEGYEGHFEHFDGGWTVGFETYTQDADFSPFLSGLPNDECQCEHLGYVIKGKVAFRSGGARGGLRNRRRLLRRTGSQADPLRRDRTGRVQPVGQARADTRSRHEEHGGGLLGADGTSKTSPGNWRATPRRHLQQSVRRMPWCR